MNVSQLLSWQWEGYARYHQSRANRLLHIQWITFPRFVLTGGWRRAWRRES